MLRRITRMTTKRRVATLLIPVIVLYVLKAHFLDREIVLWSTTPRGDAMKGGKVVDKLLVIVIDTAPARIKRRDAVRETWMTRCVREPRCAYKFLTDGQDIHGEQMKGVVRDRLEEENAVHGDIVLARSPPGLNYARRYLWVIQWLYDHYNFQYFLRLDDDYFICIDKLILELAFHRPRKGLLWGYLHCRGPENVILDQGYLLVSEDITHSILERLENGSLPCSPLLSQALATWLNDYPGLVTYPDNKRLLNDGVGDVTKFVATKNEVCHSFLGIHKSYPAEMSMFWEIFKNEKNSSYTVPPIVFWCRFKQYFDYRKSGGGWRYTLKPCKDKPVWGKGELYIGREGRAPEPIQ